jgi:hypothetical protein
MLYTHKFATASVATSDLPASQHTSMPARARKRIAAGVYVCVQRCTSTERNLRSHALLDCAREAVLTGWPCLRHDVSYYVTPWGGT